MQLPDTKPGHYYVSAIKDGHQGLYALLLGPFSQHQQALDQVDAVNTMACKLDPRAHWYSYGTCRLPIGDAAAKPGKLNEFMPEAARPCAALLAADCDDKVAA